MSSCKYCHAKRFKHESKGFCCANGEISLVINDIPQELHELFVSYYEEATKFRTCIITYNNSFAFSFFGVKYDKNLYKRLRAYIHFKYKVKFIIALMNYCHQIIIHRI